MDQKIINVAVIAHVDHGKTTLINGMLKQGGVLHDNQVLEDRVMDSNALEKERGITILAKCTSVFWKEHKINIIDTPGHADFGGEVERILLMTDGAVFLVDAAEGPMPQSKFVLSKALSVGLCPIVVINKIDRSDARPDEVLDEVFDLFISLGATDEQCDFPVLYAVGRDGWCTEDMSQKNDNLHPLFDQIIEHVKPPVFDYNAPFSMVATLLDSDSFLGRILIGRIKSGRAKTGMQIHALNRANENVETGRLTKLFSFFGVKREAVEEAIAGDIAAIAGLINASVADTICDISIEESLESQAVDPPTMSVTISVNDSPLAGTEGSKVTSTMIKDRLFAEGERNIAITVKELDDASFEVGGRGELQLGVLIESMRREGFELSVSAPKVLLKKDEAGNTIEPIEEVVIDVDEEFSGVVVEKLTMRKGELANVISMSGDKSRMVFYVPSRCMIGYQSQFMTDTKGNGVINRIFHEYAPYKGEMKLQKRGALVSTDSGQAAAYAIFNLQDRGMMFIKPQDTVYEGMIVGENSRGNDLDINVLKGKQLTNMRASGSDKTIILTPPKLMSLEEMITYIGEDELVEVTPKSLRLRKRYLSQTDRKRHARASK